MIDVFFQLAVAAGSARQCRRARPEPDPGWIHRAGRLKTVPSPVGLSGIIILTRPRCHRAGSRVRGGSVAATELQLEVDHRLIRVIGLG